MKKYEQEIKSIISDHLLAIYCYNCIYFEEKYIDYCKDCHRKNMRWSISDECLGKIVNEIIHEIDLGEVEVE